VRHLEDEGLLDFEKTAPPEANGAPEDSGSHPSTTEERRANYVRELKRKVKVASKKTYAFLTITVTHEKPTLAAGLANAIADAYLESEMESLRQGAEEATAWLSEKVREQKDKLLAAERTLRELSVDPTPKSEDVGPLIAQEINRLQQALLEVRLKLLEVQAQAAVRGDSKLSTPTPSEDAIQTDVSIALRERIRRDLVDTTMTLDQLRGRYGERHPDVIAALEKETQLREQLASLEPPDSQGAQNQVSVGSSSADFLVLESQQRLLSENLDSLMQASRSKEKAGVKAAILQREVEINRSLYNQMLSRLNEIALFSGLDSVGSRVFEPATVPSSPVSPDHPRTFLLGLVTGFLLGLGSAAIRDHLDQSVRNPMEANDLLRVPVLGVIPLNGRAKQRHGKHFELLAFGDEDYSVIAETYRILRSRLEGSVGHEDGRNLLVTSAVPGEGKTTTAANLAAAFAASGDRVLLVDGDFRRPSMSRYFHLDDEACLSQVLLGQKSLEEAVRSTWIENLDFLGSQPGKLFPAAAPLTESFRSLFRWAEKDYKRVIIDMPVVMVAPGVAEVARAGASLLLVHRPGWTTSQALEQVREHLALLKTTLLGVVLNGVQTNWLAGSYPLTYPYSRSPRALSSPSDEERS
jgi:capsular exopolysaccharide synthesis family protein